MKILIVEDDVTTRLFLSSLLEKKGLEVTAVENGALAWDVMQKTDAPLLVLLDWLMPEMDGGELCRRIRTLNNESKPYLIILTVKGEKADIIAGLEAGADDYLVKPYDPGELYARINVGQRILELQKILVDKVKALRESEGKILALLGEKDLMLKEVHHRIKNNMNTIYGLLSLQAGYLTDKMAIDALEDASSRVQSMMLLYDRLYKGLDFNEISVASYLPLLVNEIMENFPNSKSVNIIDNIDDFILHVRKLQPLGIIINELLTNIMKYAFVGLSGGEISISVSLENHIVHTIISDNGNGMPEAVSFEHSTGFGLVLVGEMTKQLGGNIRIERCKGTNIILEFEK